MQTAEDFGRRLEKEIEELEGTLLKYQGATTYLAKVEVDINKFVKKVKGEVMDGDNDVQVREMEPIDIAKYIIDCMMLVSRGVHEKLEEVAVAVPVTQGKVEGIKIAVRDAHKIYTTHKERIEAIEAELASGKVTQESDGTLVQVGKGGENLTGMHPGPSMKQESMEEDEEFVPVPLPKSKKRSPRKRKAAPKAKGGKVAQDS